MKKLKLLAASSLLAITSAGAIAGLSKVTISKMLIAGSCEHEGNHYAGSASLDQAGNREYWVCCKCHEHYFEAPAGSWTDAELTEVLASTDDRYIAPQAEAVAAFNAKVAALPDNSTYNVSYKDFREVENAVAEYNAIPKEAKGFYDPSALNVKKSIVESMSITASPVVDWSLNHWFYNVESTRADSVEKKDCAVNLKDEQYGDYIRNNVSKACAIWGNLFYCNTSIGSDASLVEQAIRGNKNLAAATMMIRTNKPGKYVVQCNSVNYYFTVAAADTWQGFVIPNDVVAQIVAGNNYSIKNSHIALEVGDYFDVTDIYGVNDFATDASTLLKVTNGYANAGASKVNLYTTSGEDMPKNTANYPTTQTLVGYKHTVTDGSALSASSIISQSEAFASTPTKIYIPVYVSRAQKVRVTEHANYNNLYNGALKAGWNYVECSTASVLEGIVTKADYITLFYFTEAQTDDIIVIGATRCAYAPAADA